MKVILTTNVKKLGKVGELVNVKDGYARNFLLPNNMALRENKKNLEYYNNIKEEIKNKEEKKLEEAKNIIEKNKVSNFASTGMYFFSSILKLRHYCQYTINNNIIQKGEYYLSSVFKSMINEGETIYPYYIDKESYKCLGTPIQVKLFTQNNLDLMPVKRYCFDYRNLRL